MKEVVTGAETMMKFECLYASVKRVKGGERLAAGRRATKTGR